MECNFEGVDELKRELEQGLKTNKDNDFAADVHVFAAKISPLIF